jgi:hypothetical protein
LVLVRLPLSSDIESSNQTGWPKATSEGRFTEFAETRLLELGELFNLSFAVTFDQTVSEGPNMMSSASSEMRSVGPLPAAELSFRFLTWA